jgi:hypothetical protein
MNRIPFGDRAQPSASTPSDFSYRAGSGLVRHRWAVWLRRGAVPAGLPPATLARGYRLAYGRPPARDPERRACCAYSATELAAALDALRMPGPEQQLGGIWAAVLQRLPLPSTRMLLLQQARLRLLTAAEALVDVERQWVPIVSARLDLLRDAFEAQLGRPVVLQLRGVEL